MIIKKSKTSVENFSKGIIYDYPLPNEKIGISYQEYLSKVRVPKTGWGINTKYFEKLV